MERSDVEELSRLVSIYGNVLCEKDIREMYEIHKFDYEKTCADIELFYDEDLEKARSKNRQLRIKYPRRTPQKRNRRFGKNFNRRSNDRCTKNKRNRVDRRRDEYRSERKRRRSNNNTNSNNVGRDNFRQREIPRKQVESTSSSQMMPKFSNRKITTNFRRVDLHGLCVNEAKSIVDNHIEDCRMNGVYQFVVIVGKGSHSAGNLASLRPAIKKHLMYRRISHRTDIENKGMIRVFLSEHL